VRGTGAVYWFFFIDRIAGFFRVCSPIGLQPLPSSYQCGMPGKDDYFRRGRMEKLLQADVNKDSPPSKAIVHRTGGHKERCQSATCQKPGLAEDSGPGCLAETTESFICDVADRLWNGIIPAADGGRCRIFGFPTVIRNMLTKCSRCPRFGSALSRVRRITEKSPGDAIPCRHQLWHDNYGR